VTVKSAYLRAQPNFGAERAYSVFQGQRYAVNGRTADGQLDDSALTLRDIQRIRESFVEQLLGMYHQRITYPENVLPMERDSRSA